MIHDTDTGEASASTLERITALANLQIAQEARVVAAEQALKDAKEALRRTEQEDLPELMRELGVEEIRLATGHKVAVKDDVQCGIAVENRPAAAEWLKEHGFGGLLKTEVIIPFPRGAGEAAHAAAQSIHDALGLDAQFVEVVHPQTLKSFVKEQREKGAPLPDSISVHPFATTKITPPKQA